MKKLILIALLSALCLGLTVNAMVKKEDVKKEDLQTDVFNGFFNDDWLKHHNNIMKEMDLMFEKQRKSMEKMQKEMLKRAEKRRKDSVQILQKEECVFNVLYGSYEKEDLQVAFNEGILAISGQKSVKNKDSEQNGNFYYAFSVGQNCEGNPQINYGKREMEIKFTVKKQHS